MPTMLAHSIEEEAWLRKASMRNGHSTPMAPPNNLDVDAGLWEPAVRTAIALEHLGDNWDGQGARGPSLELLASAIGLADLLKDQGAPPPSRIVPGPEGSVIFEWQEANGTYAEIEIDRPLHAEVLLIEPGQPAKYWTLPTA